MAKPTALVSVITPYRNAAQWLSGLVETLQNQTYSHWECLLVDHGSTDGGPDLLRHCVTDDPRFRCLTVPVSPDGRRPEGGPAVPRNIALTHATGELICFLDVDDLWHPCKLERQVQMHLGQQLDLSVTAYYRWSWRTPGQMQFCSPPSRLTAWSWRCGNPLPMLTVMLSRGMLRSLPQPNAALFESVQHEDYLLWLRLAQAFPSLRYGCVREGLAIHRRFQNNLTAQRWRMPMWTLGVYRRLGWSSWMCWLSLLVWTTAHAVRLVRERLGWGRRWLSPKTMLDSVPQGRKTLFQSDQQ